MREQLPLATVHDAILEFLRGREDAVLLGAQAVNAYTAQPRMTQDVHVASARAKELAEELRKYLSDRFHVAVRVRQLRAGDGRFRIYQLSKPANRHLADVQQVSTLPPSQLIGDVRVATPEELTAQKVIAYHSRRGQPKSGTDWRDIAVLLLAFPEFKRLEGPVRERLLVSGAGGHVMDTWAELVSQDIRAEDD